MAQTNLFKQLVVNNITLEEAPFPSELGMEAFLMDNPQILAFGDEEQDPGDPGKYPRIIGCEISLSRQDKTEPKTNSEPEPQKYKIPGVVKTTDNHSRLDMLVQYSKYTFAVLELKKGDVGKAALDQLCAYLTPARQKEIINIVQHITMPGKDGSDDEFEDLRGDDVKNVKFMGVLVGSRASEELQAVGVPTASGLGEGLPQDFRVITLSRFRNTKTGDLYVLANKMMETKKKTNKDTTTYKFDNRENLSKGLLVNAVVNYYVQKHPGISYNELKQQFPDSLQGSFGVFKEVSEAQKENDKGSRHTRYYTADDMVIELSDKKIATCNQWKGGAKNNMEKFIDHATELGLNIEPMD